MAQFQSFIEGGYEYHDTVIDGTDKYHVYVHKTGSVIVRKEDTTNDSIRFAVAKVANQTEYATLIQVANVKALTYKIRSELPF